MPERPLVTVFCPTYNHAEYITSALDGFMRQRTNFPFEVLVLDDASTDGTRDILRRYEARYPDKIKVIYREKNLYQADLGKYMEESARLMSEIAQGKYIAFCEGDDFWIDAEKLQIQADYMEANPDCTMVTHNTVVVKYWDNMAISTNCDLDTDMDLTARIVILREHEMPRTSSMFCRLDAGKMFDVFKSTADGVLIQWCFSHGRVHYMNRVMSVYRMGRPGSYTARINENEIDLTIKFALVEWRSIRRYNDYTHGRFAEYLHILACNEFRMLYEIRVNRPDSFEDMLRAAVDEDEELAEVAAIFDKCAAGHDYLSDLLSYVSNHSEIWVYGAFTSATRIVDILKPRGIAITGFVVTCLAENDRTFMGLPVVEVGDFDHRPGVGLVVGVNSSWYFVLKERFQKEGITDHLFPFMPETSCLL